MCIVCRVAKVQSFFLRVLFLCFRVLARFSLGFPFNSAELYSAANLADLVLKVAFAPGSNLGATPRRSDLGAENRDSFFRWTRRRSGRFSQELHLRGLLGVQRKSRAPLRTRIY